MVRLFQKMPAKRRGVTITCQKNCEVRFRAIKVPFDPSCRCNLPISNHERHLKQLINHSTFRPLCQKSLLLIMFELQYNDLIPVKPFTWRWAPGSSLNMYYNIYCNFKYYYCYTTCSTNCRRPMDIHYQNKSS